MKGVSLPHALLDDGVVEIAIFVYNELALARVLRHLGQVRAHEELAFEELDTNDWEHEDEEQGDEHDVADGFDGNNDALDDMLEAFSSVDGT